MKKLALALSLLALPAARALGQMCVPFCISNQSSLQAGAQFHVASGTVDGILTVGQINVSTMVVSTMTASVFVGSGTLITNLNASQLLLGTVPAGRIVGAYGSLTGVGTLTAGTWNAGTIGTQYGGTGQNFVNVGAGSLPYFLNTGTMATLNSPSFLGVLESTGTGGPPVWVSSPAIQGYNFIDIPLTALLAGNLPMSVAINDASISTVSASKVIGNISGSAAGLTANLPLSQLGSGTLSTSIVASSITAPSPGVLKGVYGDNTHVNQLTLGTDGRVSTVTVVAINLPLTSLQNGTLGSGILVPAANVQSGSLGSLVMVSSVVASGVAPGTYGGSTSIPQITVGTDGRVTNVAQFPISGGGGGGAGGSGTIGFDSVWQTTITLTTGLLREQTNVFVSTNASLFLYGATGNLVVQSSVTAGYFTGPGTGITNLQTTNIDPGILPPTVQASSITVGAVGDPQLTTSGVGGGGTFGSSSMTVTVTVNPQGRITAISSQALSGLTTITGLGTQARALNMGGFAITNALDPVNPQDVVTLHYTSQLTTDVVHLDGTETITGNKTFTGAVTFSTLTITNIGNTSGYVIHVASGAVLFDGAGAALTVTGPLVVSGSSITAASAVFGAGISTSGFNTNGTLVISTMSGVQMGVSRSTMAYGGTFFFQSTFTADGFPPITGSTYTAANVTTFFSTGTYYAGSITTPGQCLVMFAQFQTGGVAMTNPLYGIQDQAGSGIYFEAITAAANATVYVTAQLKYVGAKMAQAKIEVRESQGGTVSYPQPGLVDLVYTPFDPTTDIVYGPKGRIGSGSGTLSFNFWGMKMGCIW